MQIFQTYLYSHGVRQEIKRGKEPKLSLLNPDWMPINAIFTFMKWNYSQWLAWPVVKSKGQKIWLVSKNPLCIQHTLFNRHAVKSTRLTKSTGVGLSNCLEYLGTLSTPLILYLCIRKKLLIWNFQQVDWCELMNKAEKILEKTMLLTLSWPIAWKFL